MAMVLRSAKSVLVMTISFFLISNSLNMSDPFTSQAFPVDSKPYGIDYSSWVEKWWQWIMAIPKEKNPALDDTGINCSINQTNEHVWFLATAFGGNIHRECKIPEGKSLFIPVLIGLCDKISEPLRSSENELRSCAWSGIENAVFQLEINGHKFDNLTKYRVDTPLFNITIPSDNAWGNPTLGQDIVETQAVAAGVYVIVKPLPNGLHTIHYSSSIVDNPALGTFFYAEDIEYVINIPDN